MGGFEMQSRFMIERTTGVLMLLIVLLAVAQAVGATGVGSEEGHFRSTFPNFARDLSYHSRALIFRFAFGGVLIATAGLLYLTFRPHVRAFAAAGAAALLVSAALFFAAAVAGVRLQTLAEVWRDGGVPGDVVWLSARTTTNWVENLSSLGALMFAVSFVTFGAMFARSAPALRWIGVLSIAGAGVAAFAIVGVFAGLEELPWYAFGLGLLGVVISLVVTGGWLVVRGTRQAPGPASAAD